MKKRETGQEKTERKPTPAKGGIGEAMFWDRIGGDPDPVDSARDKPAKRRAKGKE